MKFFTWLIKRLAVFVMIMFALEIVALCAPEKPWFVRPSAAIHFGIQEDFDIIQKDIFMTVYRASIGFLVACVIGVISGILAARNRLLKPVIISLSDVLRPLPSSSVVPIVVFAIGINLSMYTFVIALGATWPILLNTFGGISSIDITTQNSLKQFQISPFSRLVNYYLPLALPSISSGMKLSLSIAFILSVTAELIAGGTSNGLGIRILNYESTCNYEGMYFSVILLGIIGFALNTVLGVVHDRLENVVSY